MYCNIAWGNAAKRHLGMLLLLQKRIVHGITHSGFRDPTEELFRSWIILDAYDLNVYCVSFSFTITTRVLCLMSLMIHFKDIENIIVIPL